MYGLLLLPRFLLDLGGFTIQRARVMRNSNTIGVDLAKNVIQVSVVTPANKELSNKELSRIKLEESIYIAAIGAAQEPLARCR